MRSFKFSDKFKTCFRVRMDDLSVRQSILISSAVQDKISELEKEIIEYKSFIEQFRDDPKHVELYGLLIKNNEEKIEEYEDIACVLGRDISIILNCHRFDVEEMPLDNILRNYKKI